MASIGKITRVNTFPSEGKRDTNVINFSVSD